MLELSRFLVIIRTMRDPDRNETIALVSGKRVGACLFFVYISNRTIPPKAGKNRIVELPADLCTMRNPDRNETIVLVSGKRVGACLFLVYLYNRTIPPKKTAGKNKIVELPADLCTMRNPGRN